MAALLAYTPFSFPLTSTRRPRILLSKTFASISTPRRKSRRRKNQNQQHDLKSGDGNSNYNNESNFTPSSAEKLLRLVFMEELMGRAREGNALGVSEVIYDMIAAGLNPGPRSFHGLVVSHVLNRDEEGAVRLN